MRSNPVVNEPQNPLRSDRVRRLLQAYVRGELSPSDQLRVQEFLRKSAAARDFVQQWGRRTAPLRKPAARKGRPLWRWLVAAMVLVAVGFLGSRLLDQEKKRPSQGGAISQSDQPDVTQAQAMPEPMPASPPAPVPLPPAVPLGKPAEAAQQPVPLLPTPTLVAQAPAEANPLPVPQTPQVAVAAPAAAADFGGMIVPFFQQHCQRCHGPEEAKSKFRVDTLRGDLGAEAEAWASILDRLERRDMPPKKEPAPDREQLERVLGWARAELKKTGRHDEALAELAYPHKGNYLDHDLLFGKKSTAHPATESRIWRFSPFGYRGLLVDVNAIRQAKDESLFAAPFGLTTDPGLRDYAFRYRVSGSETQQLILNAKKAVEHMLTGSREKRGPKELTSIAKGMGPPTGAQMQAALALMFQEVLRRPPASDERERYGAYLAKSIQRFGNRDGLIQGLAPVFLHPEAVFRLELGAGPPDQHGRVLLAPRELAYAISLALTDRPPDEALLQAAGQGRLKTRDDVRREVSRILGDPQIDKPRILRFFHEYFGYPAALDVFKDRVLGQGPGPLVEDTDRLILYVLDQDQDVLRELLTTNKSFTISTFIDDYQKALAAAKKREPDKDPRPAALEKLQQNGRFATSLAYYGITPEQWAQQPLTLPASQRAGILTQPAWLYAYSTNDHNHAILRGKWIRERLLGGSIPDTPVTVDAKLPDEPDKTLRERMRVTRDAYCWKCHQRMDPLGLAFETFDHYGAFRTQEVLSRDLSRPVNASGDVVESGDPQLDGRVDNAIQLLHKLAQSERVHQVFVRHAFRYWMGRNETLDDAPTLQAAYQAYQEKGGSMKALIVSLLTSDSFLYRRVNAEH